MSEPDAALQPVLPNLAPGPEYADDQRRFQGIPGLERTSGGRLYATWYAGGDDEGPDNYVVVVTSTDDGRSWSSPVLVVDPQGDVRAYDPCLWLDPAGRLWLFWAQSYSWFDGRAGVWASHTDQPDAACPSWSAPRRLCHGVMMNKPVVLASGEWLLPASYWRVQPNSRPEVRFDLGDERGCNVVVSRDQGANFELLGGAQTPDATFDEQHVVERRDGSLWMLARTTRGLAEATSTDGGRTWSEARPWPWLHTSSRFHLRRLASERLLMVKHSPPGPAARSYLTAYLSDDDGLTWQGGLILDERPQVSYPDGTQAPDGTLYVVYDFERYASRQILMATFTEEDVLRGRWSSAAARPRLVINQATAPRGS